MQLLSLSLLVQPTILKLSSNHIGGDGSCSPPKATPATPRIDRKDNDKENLFISAPICPACKNHSLKAHPLF